MAATAGSRTVEIAGAIEDQTACRSTSVQAQAEVMQDRCCPATASVGRHLERRPVLVSSAPGGRAVEIAGGVEDQSGIGIGAVRATAEVMDHLLRPASAPVR